MSIVTRHSPVATFDPRLAELLHVGSRYWPRGEQRLAALELPRGNGPFGQAWRMVALPAWAADLGVSSPPSLLVDAGAIVPGPGGEFDRCDWWSAAWAQLQGAAERRHEALQGPAHSYSFRLTGVDPRNFDRAWVNRIFMMLRRRAAREAGQTEEAAFGPLPTPRFVLTHDVDAVRKTANIRLKQTAFHAVNGARLMAKGRIGDAMKRTGKAVRFATSRPDYNQLNALRNLEDRFGVRSTFNFFAWPPGRRHTARQWLFDPGYDVGDPVLRREIATLQAGGWNIGLHQAFDSWDSSERMQAERERLEDVAGQPVAACRQHWLRFSWKATWAAQERAGLREDSTLGFNDRSGFRNGAALRFRPWHEPQGRPLAMEALPLVLMDSHVYDYQLVADAEIRAFLARIVDEVRFVGGEAAINWHPHTFSPDYGWMDGYRQLLELITGW